MDESKRDLRKQDFWTAIVLIIAAFFFLWRTSLLPFFKAAAAGVESGKWYNSAAIIPYFVFAALLILALGLLWVSIRDGGAKAALEKLPGADRLLNLPVLKAAAIGLILLAYIFGLVPRVDFIIASALLITAMIYGFHEGRPHTVILATGAVVAPAAYALIVHLPQSEWQVPHDDDWIAFGFFLALTAAMLADVRLRHGAMRGYGRVTPLIAVLVPLCLVCAMAFGFRQNVPNRTGLVFQQIEYGYYVRLRPWWRSL